MSSLRSVICNASGLLSLGLLLLTSGQPVDGFNAKLPRRDTTFNARERSSINSDWRFWRSEVNPDGIIYERRPDLENLTDVQTLKPWILPSGNDFINDPANRHERPDGHPGGDLPYVQATFDDDDWEAVTLPHDWAIQGPFYTEPDKEAVVGGGMGRLPVHGVGWYRRKIEVTPEDEGKQIYLDIDGAMSYAMVWFNNKLVGGWPYPYNSFRLDLTPYVEVGGDNQLAIRLDNPVKSARWYPGGGLYRSVWLTKVAPTHIGQWGTFITSRNVSAESATVDLAVEIENRAESSQDIKVASTVHIFDPAKGKPGRKVADFPRAKTKVPAGNKKAVETTLVVRDPLLWGPPPTQTPHLYVAITKLYNAKGDEIDRYETRFGIRSLEFAPDDGLRVNGEQIRIQGVNQHHDLGAIGAAFNVRAAERQLEILRDLGTNAIRMAHNPPAAELLDLTDRMGFLVMDEIFDVWERSKVDCDFHLIFSDWHEPDLRSFMRRDRNHPSIIAWSFGNEAQEQYYADPEGVEIGHRLRSMMREEDMTRPKTASTNYAMPDNDGAPFMHTMDILGLNYQGDGVRDTPNYSFLDGIHNNPTYQSQHDMQPEKLVLSTETASAFSTRGTYFFPVAINSGAPVNDSSGGSEALMYVSAYELYSADFGAVADKVFAAQDRHPFVAGEFVWTGWDYIGEPTPYYQARSSYSGIVDLAGFRKSRFYLYQARWRPDLPTVHVLPHWNWSGREGEVTPVHVFTSGDEAELFVNGESQGRKTLDQYSYRIRWDDVVYAPGELYVVAYKDGEEWARDTVRTTGRPAALRMTADRTKISADGHDLSFLTVEVVDSEGNVVPTADNSITFSYSGPGRVVATDNGYPGDMEPFPSLTRKAFSGMALAIVRSEMGGKGKIVIAAEAEGLPSAKMTLKSV